MGLYFSKAYFIGLVCEGDRFWGAHKHGKTVIRKMVSL